jgi:hypothetical protein
VTRRPTDRGSVHLLLNGTGGSILGGLKCPGREANQSPPTSSEVRGHWVKNDVAALVTESNCCSPAHTLAT